MNIQLGLRNEIRRLFVKLIFSRGKQRFYREWTSLLQLACAFTSEITRDILSVCCLVLSQGST